MARAGSAIAPGPFNFRGCDLTARMAPRQGARPGAIPGNRTNFPQAARQLAQQSLQNSVGSGQHRGGLPIFHGAVAEK